MTALQPMLSIDFGNSYTKVAIRNGRNDQTTPYREKSLIYDGEKICVPTLAARVTDAAGQVRWHFGTAVSLLTDSPRVRVFRNWKPELFKGVETRLPAEKPRPFSSPAPGSSWKSYSNEHLKDLLNRDCLNAENAAQVQTILEERKKPASSAADDADFEEIAVGYFTWLRSFVGLECAERNLGAACDIPVRITLPSFGVHEAGARRRLVNILKKAGWSPDEAQPALAEPIANIFGIATEGRNQTWTPPRLPAGSEFPAYAGMFRDSALFGAIRKHHLGKTGEDRRIYWAMVVDVGGYTTDFAMIGFDLDDIEERIQGTHQGRPRKADISWPLGVYELDSRVKEVLSPANRAGFDKVVSEVDTTRVDRLHRAIYQENRAYAYDTGQAKIGGSVDEMRQIDETVEQFASEVADLAKRFLLLHEYEWIDELILTGGGLNIPKVRDSVCLGLNPLLRGVSHIPADPDETLQGKCTRLDSTLVRGATAIGGASVIFDFSTDMY